MRKTSESGNVSIYDLTVDTAGLMQLMHAGRQTVTEERRKLKFVLETVFYGMYPKLKNIWMT